MSNEHYAPSDETDPTRTLNKATLAASIAVADALNAYMDAAGTTPEVRRAVIALRDAGDFAHQAAIEVACANAVGAPDVGFQYKGAVWKIIEFGRMLPPKSRAITRRWLDALSKAEPRPRTKSVISKRGTPKQDQ